MEGDRGGWGVVEELGVKAVGIPQELKGEGTGSGIPNIAQTKKNGKNITKILNILQEKKHHQW